MKKANIFEPFKVTEETFSSLLSHATIEVPGLQRPFAWTAEQARDLIADLRGLIAEKSKPGRTTEPQHFIGTIVTISGVGRSRVIDGQQRLTCITLLVGLIRSTLEEIRIKVEKSGNQQAEGLSERITNITLQARGLVFATDKKGDLEARFNPLPEIQETYLSFLNGGDGKVVEESLAPAVQLRKVAGVFLKELIYDKDRFLNREPADQVSYLMLLLECVTESLIFVRVNTASPSVGYSLFESLNATGQALNSLDLLKVWMLARLEGDSGAAQIEAKYHALTVEEPEIALNYMVDYFRARTFSNPGNLSPKAFSLKVRGSVFLDPSVPEDFQHASASEQDLVKRIIEHVDTMSSWYPRWVLIRRGVPPFDPKDVNLFPFYSERMQLLLSKPLGHKLPIPLLMQAAAHLSAAEFLQLTSLIERVFFRFKSICKGNESKLEKVYQDLARVLDTNHGLDLGDVQSRLSKAVSEDADDATFALMLGNTRYKPSLSAKLVYFFASLDRLSKTPPEKAVIDVKGHGYTIEHIAPQAGNGQVSEDLIHSLGNLCLLNKHENPKFSNKSFVEKKTLSNNGIALSSRLSVKVFAENSTWTDDEVEARKQFLIQEALKVFTPNLLL